MTYQLGVFAVLNPYKKYYKYDVEQLKWCHLKGGEHRYGQLFRAQKESKSLFGWCKLTQHLKALPGDIENYTEDYDQ